jgi:putative membrane protein
MMNGLNGGMGAGGWLFMSLFWVLLLVVIVWAAAQLFPGRRAGAATTTGPFPEPQLGQPQQILDRRLASGEIDVATYEQLRETLAKPGAGELR